ncbi:DUF927 domain-containing protein [Rhodovulum sp. YNF3179]|uniref:DUF927 domain-containing protein n=1 Tax=Rhodovulum sp. YNF3179 TaxID=3425127 RepID=UPI003D32A1E6
MSENEIKKAFESAEDIDATPHADQQESRPKGGGSRKRRKKYFPFKVENGRVWRHIQSEDDDSESRKKWVPFVSEVNVLASTRSANGDNWGRLVEVVDRDGNRHRWAMPLEMLAGSGEELRRELLSRGLEPVPGVQSRKWKEWLNEYLTSADPAASARCVSNIGWHDETFVLPDETIDAGGQSEEVLLQSAERLDHAMNAAGDLSDWRQSIAAEALGNSRLVLAISAAFAAPLLAITGQTGGGFHLRGGSSIGKSTALAVAGSVWGGGGVQGYVRNWRTTDNALEALAAMHDDSLLCLDELSQIEPRAAAAAAYMLANGRGKSRAGKDGQARRGYEWRTLFLSTGEISLADKIREGGGNMAAGMEVRVVDLRADTGSGLGIFERLPDGLDAPGFAVELNNRASRFYGTPIREFLHNLVSDIPAYRTRLNHLQSLFTDSTLPKGADGQVGRVAARFAIVAAAGEIASEMGITGWGKAAATTAVSQCFSDWLKDRGGTGSGEVTEACRRLRHAIETDGQSRFLPWYHDPRTVVRIKTLGYVRRPREEEDAAPTLYFFHGSGLRDLLSGLDFRSVTAGLAKIGVIIPPDSESSDGKAGRLSKVWKVPSEERSVRLYQVDADLIAAGASDGDA